MRNRLGLALLAVALCLAAPKAFFHFELLKSTPAAKASLTTPPTRLHLWFSQVPAAGVSQITLSTKAGAVELGKTVISATDKSMYADPVKPLGVGFYTIHWRGAGDDGHVQTGTINFAVSPK